MSKKQEKTAAEHAARMEAERRKAIAEFNMNNKGKYVIDPDHVPTEEEVRAAQKDFEYATALLNEKNDYVVADKANALRVAKFMREFIGNAHWDQRYFVGVINFCAMIDDFINNFDENNPVDLVMEYGPMQFAQIMFSNYSGNGLEEAKHMAEIYDEFIPIHDKLHEITDWYDAERNKCEDLRNRWAMYAQGFAMEIINPEENVETTPVESVEQESEQSAAAESAEEKPNDDNKDE